MMKLWQLYNCYHGQIRVYSIDGVLLYESRNNVCHPSDNLMSKTVWNIGVDDDGVGIEVTLTDRMYYDGEPTGNFEEV